jgi:hypothetical protein
MYHDEQGQTTYCSWFETTLSFCLSWCGLIGRLFVLAVRDVVSSEGVRVHQTGPTDRLYSEKRRCTLCNMTSLEHANAMLSLSSFKFNEAAILKKNGRCQRKRMSCAGAGLGRKVVPETFRGLRKIYDPLTFVTEPE